MPSPGAAIQLDDLSKQIIEKLQQDGRRSYAGIGKAVGLSEAAVRQRVQRMAAIESVDYVVPTAGSFDAIVDVVCAGDDDLLDLLNTQIRALPGVSATETLVYLKLVKQQ
ncbi:Lrp/AsnC family transcriptional regulator [Mycobacterium sp. E740]|uniref:Lrp/AsnC family transcriptional regulator n=1 Tax=Mycobacterium sp. E740 TaxID=1834149 RepID=UPI0008006099|nr:Lrp/AsnC family transcriptional regulator [Mycobacterium sp. E740]OBI71469.1 hypothetical protein A5663_08955 [Mycobacterium sp. E740]